MNTSTPNESNQKKQSEADLLALGHIFELLGKYADVLSTNSQYGELIAKYVELFQSTS